MHALGKNLVLMSAVSRFEFYTIWHKRMLKHIMHPEDNLFLNPSYLLVNFLIQIKILICYNILIRKKRQKNMTKSCNEFHNLLIGKCFKDERGVIFRSYVIKMSWENLPSDVTVFCLNKLISSCNISYHMCICYVCFMPFCVGSRQMLREFPKEKAILHYWIIELSEYS